MRCRAGRRSNTTPVHILRPFETSRPRLTLKPAAEICTLTERRSPNSAPTRRYKRCSASGRLGSGPVARGVLLGGSRRKVHRVRKMTVRRQCVIGSTLWLASLISLRSFLVVKGRRLVVSRGLYVKLGRLRFI